MIYSESSYGNSKISKINRDYCDDLEEETSGEVWRGNRVSRLMKVVPPIEPSGAKLLG